MWLFRTGQITIRANFFLHVRLLCCWILLKQNSRFIWNKTDRLPNKPHNKRCPVQQKKIKSETQGAHFFSAALLFEFSTAFILFDFQFWNCNKKNLFVFHFRFFFVECSHVVVLRFCLSLSCFRPDASFLRIFLSNFTYIVGLVCFKWLDFKVFVQIFCVHIRICLRKKERLS